VVAEFVVRTWLVSPSATVANVRYQWNYLPHARVVFSTEGWSASRTNSMGLLDDEPRVPRAPVRALLLGDSYAEALQVRRRDNFSSVAEERMPGLEVLNTGCSGRGPQDYADWLAEFGAALAPDVVVVCFNAGDLVSLEQMARSGRSLRPRPTGPSPPPPPEGPLARLAHRVLRSSGLITAARQRFKLVAQQILENPFTPFRPPRPSRAAAMSDDELSDPRLAAMLDSLHVRFAARAPRLVYLYLPVMDYFAPTPHRGDAAAARVMHDFAARHHATLVDMYEPMRAEFVRTGRPLHGFSNSVLGTGHMNAAGHRLTGERLAQVIAGAVR